MSSWSWCPKPYQCLCQIRPKVLIHDMNGLKGPAPKRNKIFPWFDDPYICVLESTEDPCLKITLIMEGDTSSWRAVEDVE